MDGLEDTSFPLLGLKKQLLSVFFLLLKKFWKVILKSPPRKEKTFNVLAYFTYKTRVSVEATVASNSGQVGLVGKWTTSRTSQNWVGLG